MTQCEAVKKTDGYRNDYCSRKAVNVEDGRGWCTQHTPSLVKARQDERSRKWQADWDAKLAHKDASKARQERINSILTRLAAIDTDTWDGIREFADMNELVNDAKEVLSA